MIRSDFFKLRVSPAEKVEIKRRAAAEGLDASDYVRRCALGPETAVVSDALGPLEQFTVDVGPEPATGIGPAMNDRVARRAAELEEQGLPPAAAERVATMEAGGLTPA